MFVHLLAGAALGAVVVLMVWIFSGGRPFGEVVGTSDVSAPTTASVKQTDVQQRTAAPAGAAAQLASEPPDLGAASTSGGDSLRFRKEKAERAAKAKAKAKRTNAAKAKARSRARKRQAERVAAPPSGESSDGDALPVAAVPSPTPTGTPAPEAPAPAAKPAKPRTPTFVAGAGEG